MIHYTTWLDSLITHPEGIHKDYTPHETRRTYEERLNHMQKILETLENPQQAYRAVHVTGTSGKGSVATMAAALLQVKRFRVGLHISPYVQFPTEKIQIDGLSINTIEFNRSISQLKKTTAKHKPTYGQAWTALVHAIFRNERVDWGVCEARMGGRYDETNLINSKVAVIINVDYDHVAQLGPSRNDIAWHKAGIIKPGMPCVTAVTNEQLLAIIKSEAQEKKSRLYCFGKDFTAFDVTVHDVGITASFTTPYATYRNIYINLSGRYQAQNAACAIMAAQLALRMNNQQLSENEVQRALEAVSIPGRFEIMQQQPLCVLDGAHNPAKMTALSELVAERYSKKRITAMLGVLESKDVHHTIAPILPFVANVIATEPQVRGKLPLPASKLAAAIKSIQSNLSVDIVPEPHKALLSTFSRLNKQNSMLLVTGSLYLVGNIREHWRPT